VKIGLAQARRKHQPERKHQRDGSEAWRACALNSSIIWHGSVAAAAMLMALKLALKSWRQPSRSISGLALAAWRGAWRFGIAAMARQMAKEMAYLAMKNKPASIINGGAGVSMARKQRRKRMKYRQ
jgi:hypothetical protein